MEIERVGDADVLENVDLAGGELLAGEERLRGLVGAQGFDGVAEAAIDGAGVGEQLGVFGGREGGAGGLRELVILERLLILAELLVEDGEVGENELAAAGIPGLGGGLFDAAQAELVALQGVEVFALEEIDVADVAEAGDFAFAIVLRAIELEGVLEALEGGGILAAVEVAQADGIGGERFVGGVGALAEEAGGLGCGFGGARILAEGEGGLGEFEQGLRIFRGGAEGGKERFVGLERGAERSPVV